MIDTLRIKKFKADIQPQITGFFDSEEGEYFEQIMQQVENNEKILKKLMKNQISVKTLIYKISNTL